MPYLCFYSANVCYLTRKGRRGSSTCTEISLFLSEYQGPTSKACWICAGTVQLLLRIASWAPEGNCHLRGSPILEGHKKEDYPASTFCRSQQTHPCSHPQPLSPPRLHRPQPAQQNTHQAWSCSLGEGQDCCCHGIFQWHTPLPGDSQTSHTRVRQLMRTKGKDFVSFKQDVPLLT